MKPEAMRASMGGSQLRGCLWDRGGGAGRRVGRGVRRGGQHFNIVVGVL